MTRKVSLKMIVTLFIVAALSVPSFEQSADSVPISPCPNVFQYETLNSENAGPASRWYGVVNLSTDSTLHSLWLNIVLDRKADILGNWIGDVTTTDNIDFKIENTTLKIIPGPATPMRFFVQYSAINPTPRVQAIRLNGREICNANKPRPTEIDRPDSESNRPSFVKQPDSSISRPSLDRRPEVFETRPVEGRPTYETVGPVYVRPNNPLPVAPSLSGGDPSQQVIPGQSRPNNVYQVTPSPGRDSTRRPTQQDVSNDDDQDYFEGGQPTFIIPSNSGPTNPNRSTGEAQCGKVVLNNPVPLVVNGRPTLEGQWPWQIALYQTQTIDNKYLCGGTLVSHRHVITAAHCVTRKKSRNKVDPNTLTVYLGKHNLRTSVVGVQIRFVEDIIVHPSYNASTYSRDAAILVLREPVTYTDWVRPACLWPEDQIDVQNIIGQKGSVVGWGFDATGVATEELGLVEMPVVDEVTCLRSYNEFFIRFTSEYTYCAGYRDGTSVCNGDSGGGMVFKNGGTWYLRGLVSLSVARQNEYRCDPSHYVIFTDLAKFLPWIKQNVNDF